MFQKILSDGIGGITRRSTIKSIGAAVVSSFGASRPIEAADTKEDEPWWTVSGTAQAATMNPSALPNEYEATGSIKRPESTTMEQAGKRRRSGPTPQPPADQVQKVPIGGDSQ